MLTVTTVEGGILRLDVGGKPTPAEMDEGIQRLLASAETMASLRLLYVFQSDFAMPGPEALRVEFRYITRLWGLLRKMDRVALVCDVGWIRTAASVESALIPGLVIRNFDPGEEDAALAWLRGRRPAGA